jgi:hypothetical protein
MKETTYIQQTNNFGTLFACSLVTLKTNKMRTSNLITSALIISFGVSAVGITQANTWEQLYMFTFGAVMSLLMLGLIASEK